MNRIRCKARKIVIVPLLVVLLITTVLLINNTFLRRVFYYYQIDFYGTPGSYLSAKTPNESYCNFKYGLPEQLLYEEADLLWPPEEKSKSKYRVLKNVLEASTEPVFDVTYATHATPDFLNYLAEIIRFWDGPISVALFVPDLDATLAIDQLSQLCTCSPEMSRVSVHFVFPTSLPAQIQHQEVEKAGTCQVCDSSKLQTFRNVYRIMYPINVCRNIARNWATTNYVMVADIQLIPSEELAFGFMEMVRKANPSPRVYVVPVFEIEAHDAIPRRKDELLMMVKEERAVYFHRHVCSHCQKFPGIKTWLATTGEDVKPFVVVKREYPFHRWEPIYIGSKNDPLYSESLSWEGLQDKMVQMLEMCLIGYQFVILDGAFLVHWPGIKKTKHKFVRSEPWRAQFQTRNSRHYSRIVKELKRKYRDNPKCKVQ